MKKYLDNVLVCLNKFTNDTEEEIEVLKNYCQQNNIPFAINNTWALGSDGGIDLANKAVELLENKVNFNMLYPDNISIIEKIKTVCKNIYGADDIEVSQEIINKITKYEQMGYSNLPVCIAKTQYSLSDNPKLLGRPTNFNINIKDVKLCSGTGFIVVIAGNIMTMPGLSKQAAYLNMDIDKLGNIKGLF